MTTKTISHYEILAPIGQGGMGVVYRALETSRPAGRAQAAPPDGRTTREPPALRPGGAGSLRLESPAHRDRLRDRPGRRRLHRDGVRLRAHAWRERRARGSDRTGAHPLEIAVQIADALAARTAGMLHRDLKPGNVMVTGTGPTRCSTSGSPCCPRVIGSEERQIENGHPARSRNRTGKKILGTVAYMSPEQAEGGKLDARSEIFSFGVVLYEMLTGKRPFRGRYARGDDGRDPARRARAHRRIKHCDLPGPGPNRDALPEEGPGAALSDDGGPQGRASRTSWKSPDSRSLSRGGRHRCRPAGGPRAAASRDSRRSRSQPWCSARGCASHVAIQPAADWPQALSDAAHVGPRLDRLSRDFAGWQAAGVFVGLQRGRQSRHLDSAHSGWRSRQIDAGSRGRHRRIVLSRRQQNRVSLHPGRRWDSDPHPDAGRRRTARRWPRLFAALFAGRSMAGVVPASPDQDGSRIYVTPADGGPATLLAPPGFYRTLGPRVVNRRSSLLFWGTTQNARRRRNTTPIGTSWAVPAGSPIATDARPCCCRQRVFQAFQGLPSPDAWASANNRILFHGAVGDSSNMWQVAISPEKPPRHRRSAEGHLRHHRRSRGLGDLRRTHGVHQPDDRIGYLEPSNRRRARETIEASSTASTQDSADDYAPTLSDVRSRVAVPFAQRAGRFAIVLRGDREQRGNAPDQALVRSLWCD